MFYNFLILLVLILPSLLFVLGFKLGREEKTGFKKPISNFGRNKELSEEERKSLKEWENILNYDGTRESQEEL